MTQRVRLEHIVPFLMGAVVGFALNRATGWWLDSGVGVSCMLAAVFVAAFFGWKYCRATLIAPADGEGRVAGALAGLPFSPTHFHAAPSAAAVRTKRSIAATAFVHLLSSFMLFELSSTR